MWLNIYLALVDNQKMSCDNEDNIVEKYRPSCCYVGPHESDLIGILSLGTTLLS